MTNREKAIEQVKQIDDDTIYEWQVLAHTGHTSRWVEVYPDGYVVETEEADDSTTHWIDYPKKEVYSVHGICHSNSRYCDCIACTIINRYNDYLCGELEKKEFEEKFGFDPDSLQNEPFLKTLDDCEMIIDPEEIRIEMIESIRSIYNGYFDDEEEVEEEE